MWMVYLYLIYEVLKWGLIIGGLFLAYKLVYFFATNRITIEKK